MTTLSLGILRRETMRPRRRVAATAARRWLDVVRAAWRRRQSRVLLAQLDDRMLQDIGITRADAQFEANRPFWRE